ncbi:MAG: hypothetical protein LUH11_04390 [Candidatus Gastranaerophilales bacterium]|nr:hypothetical protein [Candidatus Gastranaerophilales bacterium]
MHTINKEELLNLYYKPLDKLLKNYLTTAGKKTFDDLKTIYKLNKKLERI